MIGKRLLKRYKFLQISETGYVLGGLYCSEYVIPNICHLVSAAYLPSLPTQVCYIVGSSFVGRLLLANWIVKAKVRP